MSKQSRMINLKDFDFQDLLEFSLAPSTYTSTLNDVEFKILDNANKILGTVKSHKLLLSLMSPVLKKVFTSKEEGLVIIEITGPSLLSFQTLIQFLYSGDKSILTGRVENIITFFRIYMSYFKKIFSLNSAIIDL